MRETSVSSGSPSDDSQSPGASNARPGSVNLFGTSGLGGISETPPEEEITFDRPAVETIDDTSDEVVDVDDDDGFSEEGEEDDEEDGSRASSTYSYVEPDPDLSQYAKLDDLSKYCMLKMLRTLPSKERITCVCGRMLPCTRSKHRAKRSDPAGNPVGVPGYYEPLPDSKDPFLCDGRIDRRFYSVSEAKDILARQETSTSHPEPTLQPPNPTSHGAPTSTGHSGPSSAPAPGLVPERTSALTWGPNTGGDNLVPSGNTNQAPGRSTLRPSGGPPPPPPLGIRRPRRGASCSNCLLVLPHATLWAAFGHTGPPAIPGLAGPRRHPG